MSTCYERFLEKQLADPVSRGEYEQFKRQIEAIDRLYARVALPRHPPGPAS